MARQMKTLPVIDPNIKHVGVSKMRIFNSEKLRELNGTVYVIQDNYEPLAVLVSYETFLLIQSVKEVMPSDTTERSRRKR